MRFSSLKLMFASYIFIILSCNSSQPNLESLDLLSYGLPMKIHAPAGSEVVFDDLGIMKDVTIKGSDNFNIQIYSTETDYLSVDKAMLSIKDEIENSPYFSKIISQDEGGIIFEKKVSDDYINYDFRHVKLRGDTKYTFQAGFGNQYDLDDVKIMYKAVQ